MRRLIIEEDLKDIYRRDISWDELKNSTVLITGAYGMLASYMAYMLIYLNECCNMNIRIIAVVRSEEKLKKRFVSYANREYFSIYQGSLSEALYIEENIDYIIHAASFASPQYYATCPVDVLKPNVIGNFHLLELAREKNVKGYLFFSSGDVYGKVAGISTISEKDTGAIDPLDIHSCYSESKRMAETMCYAYFEQYNVPVKILRIWHTYAPTMDIENDPRVYASFMNNIVNGNDIVIKSDGAGMRSFCYIADAVAAFFIVLLKAPSGEAYNVCNTAEFYSIKELAELLVPLRQDKKLNVVIKKRAHSEHYVENMNANSVPPSDKKLRALGWEPEYTTKQGFIRVYKYLTM